GRLLKQAGAAIAPLPATVAPIPARITIRSGAQHVGGTDFRKKPDWIFEGDMGGVAFSARGIATDGYVPTGNGPFTLDSADAAPLLRLLGVIETSAQEKIPLGLKGHAEFGLGGLRAQNFSGMVGAKTLTGGMLHWPFLPDAKLRGNLAFAEFSLGELTGFLLGPEASSGTGLWPSGRFAPPRRPLVDFDVEVTAATMPLGALTTARNASMRIASMPGGMRMPGFGADFAGGRLGFHMTFRQEGTLVSASGRIEATGNSPTAFGIRAIGGHFDTLIDVAGVGESITQIIQSISGAGQINTRNAKIESLDPAAAQRVLTQLQGKDAPNAATLAAAIEQELPKAAWTLGNVSLPLTLTRGVARIGPAQSELNAIAASGQIVADLRSAQLDASVTMGQRRGEAIAEQTVRWAGPFLNPRRNVDASGLLNILQLAAIQRETERIGVLEQDARERAAFNRRARAEREQREREEAKRREAEDLQRRADLERRAAEEAVRRAEQERRALEELARRASEAPPVPAQRAPAAPLAITPR
ncbi:MAG: AsmA-like C-terminal region-containing protein, partial [Beijerinckiaceae bacterium]